MVGAPGDEAVRTNKHGAVRRSRSGQQERLSWLSGKWRSAGFGLTQVAPNDDAGSRSSFCSIDTSYARLMTRETGVLAARICVPRPGPRNTSRVRIFRFRIPQSLTSGLHVGLQVRADRGNPPDNARLREAISLAVKDFHLSSSSWQSGI